MVCEMAAILFWPQCGNETRSESWLPNFGAIRKFLTHTAQLGGLTRIGNKASYRLVASRLFNDGCTAPARNDEYVYGCYCGIGKCKTRWKSMETFCPLQERVLNPAGKLERAPCSSCLTQQGASLFASREQWQRAVTCEGQVDQPVHGLHQTHQRGSPPILGEG